MAILDDCRQNKKVTCVNLWSKWYSSTHAEIKQPTRGRRMYTQIIHFVCLASAAMDFPLHWVWQPHCRSPARTGQQFSRENSLTILSNSKSSFLHWILNGIRNLKLYLQPLLLRKCPGLFNRPRDYRLGITPISARPITVKQGLEHTAYTLD